MSNPLIDTLFRPTTAPQRRPAGGLGRAGARHRDAQPRRQRDEPHPGRAARRRAPGRRGQRHQDRHGAGGRGRRRGQGTLYNHFRTREAVVSAVLLAQVQPRSSTTSRASALDVALADAATGASRPTRCAAAWRGSTRPRSSRSPASTRTPRRWQLARAAVGAALAAAGRGGVDMVLRWLASYLLTPAGTGRDRRRRRRADRRPARRTCGRRAGSTPARA